MSLLFVRHDVARVCQSGALAKHDAHQTIRDAVDGVSEVGAAQQVVPTVILSQLLEPPRVSCS